MKFPCYQTIQAKSERYFLKKLPPLCKSKNKSDKVAKGGLSKKYKNKLKSYRTSISTICR
jgi:hypothetical protein